MPDNERQPLLARDGDSRDAGREEPKKHYNTVGLSQGAFWALVSSSPLGQRPRLTFQVLSSLTAAFLNALDGMIVAALLSPISSSFYATNLASWLGTS